MYSNKQLSHIRVRELVSSNSNSFVYKSTKHIQAEMDMGRFVKKIWWGLLGGNNSEKDERK